MSGTYEAVVLMTVTMGTAVTSIVLLGCLGILCKSLLVAMAKELEQRALQALSSASVTHLAGKLRYASRNDSTLSFAMFRAQNA